jgi:glutathione S-transferase
MTLPVLFIGNRAYSSWSLRPWLVLRWAGISFEERLINLDAPGYAEQSIAEVRAVSPSGRVPALRVGADSIWDSLAIAEWAAEQRPQALLWPTDPVARMYARCATAEMHSGFAAVREHLPMCLRVRRPEQAWNPATRRELDRIRTLWTSLRERFGAGGPWLLGARSIADAFFAPVVTRLRTYSVAMPPVVNEYCETVLEDADFLEWEKAGLAEPAPQRFVRQIDERYA